MRPNIDMIAEVVPDGDADLDEVNFDRFQIPSCEQCAGILKPDVVFYGEAVSGDIGQQAYAAVKQADAILVIGSSLMVYSEYRFCRAALEQNNPIAVVNQGRTRVDDGSVLKIDAECGWVLEGLVQALEVTVAV